tara:strand:+ start:1209 stop:2909 length:1701 start_codon:yes stop_codon:yes gene_type:complete
MFVVLLTLFLFKFSYPFPLSKNSPVVASITLTDGSILTLHQGSDIKSVAKSVCHRDNNIEICVATVARRLELELVRLKAGTYCLLFCSAKCSLRQCMRMASRKMVAPLCGSNANDETCLDNQLPEEILFRSSKESISNCNNQIDVNENVALATISCCFSPTISLLILVDGTERLQCVQNLLHSKLDASPTLWFPLRDSLKGKHGKNRRVAFIQLSNSHTETIGSFIETFLSSEQIFEWSIDIFADSKHLGSFIKLLKKAFQGKGIHFYSPHHFLSKKSVDIEKYDTVVLLTSTDLELIEEEKIRAFILNFGFIVAHYLWQRVQLESLGYRVLSLTPLIGTTGTKRDNLFPMLPRKIISEFSNLYEIPQRKTLLVVGFRAESVHSTSYFSKHIEDLVRILKILKRDFMKKKSTSWRLVMVGKDNEVIRQTIDASLGLDTSAQAIDQALKWWSWKTACSTECLLQLAIRATYILPLAPSFGSYHLFRLTAAIPLALSFGIPLIIDSRLSQIYKIENASIQYESSITETLQKAMKIVKLKLYRNKRKNATDLGNEARQRNARLLSKLLK